MDLDQSHADGFAKKKKKSKVYVNKLKCLTEVLRLTRLNSKVNKFQNCLSISFLARSWRSYGQATF